MNFKKLADTSFKKYFVLVDLGCLDSEILIINTWNEYIKESDGMVNLFFLSKM